MIFPDPVLTIMDQIAEEILNKSKPIRKLIEHINKIVIDLNSSNTIPKTRINVADKPQPAKPKDAATQTDIDFENTNPRKISIFDGPKLEVFYKEAMEAAVANENPICPILLEKAHDFLFNEILSIFENDTISNEFSKRIEIIFRDISMANVELLDSMQNKVRGIIAKHKSKYDIIMNEFIKEPLSADNSTFLKKHESLKEQLKNEMFENLREEIPFNEPVSTHVKTLGSILDKSKISYQVKLFNSKKKLQLDTKQEAASNTTLRSTETAHQANSNNVILRERRHISNHPTDERVKGVGAAANTKSQNRLSMTTFLDYKGTFQMLIQV